jgi:hypothetical protein
MGRMFRVLSFWTLIFGLLALAKGGELKPMAMICFFQTAVFLTLGYMKLSERTYILLFWSYMVISFIGFTYWSFFKLEL